MIPNGGANPAMRSSTRLVARRLKRASACGNGIAIASHSREWRCPVVQLTRARRHAPAVAKSTGSDAPREPLVPRNKFVFPQRLGLKVYALTKRRVPMADALARALPLGSVPEIALFLCIGEIEVRT